MSRTILLADDSLTIQKVVELTFADTQYSVVALSSGEQLLQQLPAVRPDVIICDIIMPGKDGYQVCQEIKSDPDTLHIPVVLLSGTFEPFDRDRALAAGCSEIITKPFEARKLVETVDRLLSAPPEEMPMEPVSAVDGESAETLYTPGSVVPPPAVTSEPMAAAAPLGHEEQVETEESGLDFTDTGFADMEAAGATVPEQPADLPEDGLDFEFSDEGEALADGAADEERGAMAAEAEPVDDEEPTAVAAEELSAATDPDVNIEADAAVPMEPPPEEPFPETEAGAEDVGRFMFDRAGPFLDDTDGAGSRITGGPVQEYEVAEEEPVAEAAEEVPHPMSALPPAIEPTAPPLAAWEGLGHAADREGRGDEDEQPPEEEPESALGFAAEPEHPGTEPPGLWSGPETDAGTTPPEPASAPPEETTAAPAAAAALSDEDVDRVARRLLELAADRIESVAWEVIPDMAEIVVRERLRQLEAEAERAPSDSVQ